MVLVNPYDVLSQKPPPVGLALLPNVGGQLTLDAGWETRLQPIAYSNTVVVQRQDFSPLGNQVSVQLQATFNQDDPHIVSAVAHFVLMFASDGPPVPLGLAALPRPLEFGAVGAALTLTLALIATKTRFGGA